MSQPQTGVLLLHGQPGSAADWDAVTQRLDASPAVLAGDRPGWDGKSPARSLAGNADAAIAALDRHGLERAVVAGHSLGAAVAAWLGAFHPTRVSALVLVSPAANLASLYRVDRWLAAPVVGELVSAAAMWGIGLTLTPAPVRHRIAAVTGLRDAYLRSARAVTLRPAAWRAYAREQRALVQDLPELDQGLGAIAAPTTILAGATDRIVPLRAAQLLARQIPRAQLVVSQRSGHLLLQRDPDLVARAIRAALDGGPAPA